MLAGVGAAGLQAVVNVRLASDEPTDAVDNDDRIAQRVAEAATTAFAWPETRVFLDTLVDQDRGNHPRHGLIDRRFNPRPASRVLRHLQAALVELGAPLVPGAARELGSARVLPLSAPCTDAELVLPDAGAPLPPLAEAARVVDLESSAVLGRVPDAEGPLLLVRPRAGQAGSIQAAATKGMS